jgi:hypothetical protein
VESSISCSLEAKAPSIQRFSCALINYLVFQTMIINYFYKA